VAYALALVLGLTAGQRVSKTCSFTPSRPSTLSSRGIPMLILIIYFAYVMTPRP
jgi:hypothetical protein